VVPAPSEAHARSRGPPAVVGTRGASPGPDLVRRRADDRLLPRAAGVPLTELFQNRDYVGSTHFFFDIGNANALAFFDFPGLGLTEYAEVLGGHHHLAISVSRENWERLQAKLEAADVAYHLVGDTSMYFMGPDGERIELISDPLGEMYGMQVL
jgi:catechol 2,3-dioxygenase-like lactoylglutathione lyase family enzyme